MLTVAAEIQGANMAGERCVDAGCRDSAGGPSVLPPRMLEMLMALNQVFDAQSFAEDSP